MNTMRADVAVLYYYLAGTAHKDVNKYMGVWKENIYHWTNFKRDYSRKR